MPTNGFSIKPLKVELLAGEQKATEFCISVWDPKLNWSPLAEILGTGFLRVVYQEPWYLAPCFSGAPKWRFSFGFT